MVKVRWNDKQFERVVLNPAAVRFMTRIGIRGEAISKELISGELKAVDTGRLRASLTHEVDTYRIIVRIGTNVKYAIYVFLGTAKMAARPVLRTMLHRLRVEFR